MRTTRPDGLPIPVTSISLIGFGSNVNAIGSWRARSRRSTAARRRRRRRTRPAGGCWRCRASGRRRPRRWWRPSTTAAPSKGRDFAAWLGLTLRESSTGGKQRLGRISKRGNQYLRTLLVRRARSGLDTLSKRRDRLGAWLRRQLESKQQSVVIVALAARLARIAWALLHKGGRFAPEPEVAPAG